MTYLLFYTLLTLSMIKGNLEKKIFIIALVL